MFLLDIIKKAASFLTRKDASKVEVEEVNNKRGPKLWGEDAISRWEATLWEDVEEMEVSEGTDVCLSKGNKKVPYWNISLLPYVSCPPSCPCRSACYAVRSCSRWKTCRAAWARNTALALEDPVGFWDSVNTLFKRKRSNKNFFRLHVAGDFLNMNYMIACFDFVGQNSNTKFWTYTKKYSLLIDYLERGLAIPQNLTILVSIWILPDGTIYKEKEARILMEKYGLPCFVCILEGMPMIPSLYECKGKCKECAESGHGCMHGECVQVRVHS